MKRIWALGLMVFVTISLADEISAQRKPQKPVRKSIVKTSKQSTEKRNTQSQQNNQSQKSAQSQQSSQPQQGTQKIQPQQNSQSQGNSQLQQDSQSQPKTLSAEFPKVILIDETELQKVLTPKGKPLLVNFWATWCDPCREEFPDLVKISADYADKLDVITISLDDPVEINRDVPKFLAEMNAKMPAYLLKATDESAAINMISPKWQGGLPFTILLSADGKEFYSRFGKFNTAVLREQIEKLLATK